MQHLLVAAPSIILRLFSARGRGQPQVVIRYDGDHSQYGHLESHALGNTHMKLDKHIKTVRESDAKPQGPGTRRTIGRTTMQYSTRLSNPVTVETFVEANHPKCWA